MSGVEKVFGEDELNNLLDGIKEVCQKVKQFRKQEGDTLQKDLEHSVSEIERLMTEISKFDEERIVNIKSKISTALKTSEVSVDHERFEYEMIYYLEKLDINEEKIRLDAHCKYFVEVLNADNIAKGKKAWLYKSGDGKRNKYSWI